MTEPTHPSPSFDPHGERIRFEQLRATLGNVMTRRQRAEAE
jgi:hypothetical protein